LPSRPGARRVFARATHRTTLSGAFGSWTFARPRHRKSSFGLGRDRLTILWATRRLSTSATLTTREHTRRAFDHRPRKRPRSLSLFVRGYAYRRTSRRAAPAPPANRSCLARVESARAKDSPEGERPSSWLLPSTRVADSPWRRGWRHPSVAHEPAETRFRRRPAKGADFRRAEVLSTISEPRARGLLLARGPDPLLRRPSLS